MAQYDFNMEPMEDRDLSEREDRCQKAIRTVTKAMIMRLFICGLLLWVVLRTALDLWVIGLMVLVIAVNVTGMMPLVAELKKRRSEWKHLLEEEE